MNTCYIACALDCKIEIEKDETDLIIGADKGYFILIENGIKPDVVIGDFDSYKGAIDCENVIRFPVKKDDTDSALAVKYAIEKGYEKIVVFGAIGGMLDHTIANISLMGSQIINGVKIILVDNENVIFPVYNEKISFEENASGRISVFSLTNESYGVFEKGLLYSLENYTLSNLHSLGVSNEFIGESAEISVENGILLVYTSKNNFEKYLTK
ncbi:MAG: thiamine diphosphokinase [Clostridia bacterium]|nr:thiamine diphosphokinase [Clostridia bacterium]